MYLIFRVYRFVEDLSSLAPATGEQLIKSYTIGVMKKMARMIWLSSALAQRLA